MGCEVDWFSSSEWGLPVKLRAGLKAKASIPSRGVSVRLERDEIGPSPSPSLGEWHREVATQGLFSPGAPTRQRGDPHAEPGAIDAPAWCGGRSGDVPPAPERPPVGVVLAGGKSGLSETPMSP